MDRIESITTEMAEYVCDELCRHPRESETYPEEECAECKLGQFICDILNECEKN